METTICFWIANKSISVLVLLTTVCKIILCFLMKVIMVYQIKASIIRWVNVNHFNPMQI